MKQYEAVTDIVLTQRMPLIIRVDGRSFHHLLKRAHKPYDERVMRIMKNVCQALVSEISGSKIAYSFSDEISLLATDYDALNTEAWFGKRLQKLVSVASSIATLAFNQSAKNWWEDVAKATFDARAFVIPKDDVNNYFLWRQRDCERCSLNALCLVHFSHKKLQNLKAPQRHELLHTKDVNWNDRKAWEKRGFCVLQDKSEDLDIPIFSQNHNYIDRFVDLNND